jgi:hypothetical protein
MLEHKSNKGRQGLLTMSEDSFGKLPEHLK